MTRAHKASLGLGSPPPLHHWMNAVLMLCVSLVRNAASTLQMILLRCMRDWHTRATDVDLPRETSGISETGTNQSSPSFSGKAEGRIPGIPVVSSRGTTTHSPEALNQDARHKAEHDTVGVYLLEADPLGYAFPATCLFTLLKTSLI